MKLGVLDLQGVIEDTVELAPLADRLGYSRFWIGEHPPQPSPITLLGVIAGLTERIRVGTAAILFHYYPPARTAFDFQLLERLYEGRIDAGLSPGSAAAQFVSDNLDGRDPEALIRAYPNRFAEFMRHLRNTPSSAGYDEERSWRGAPPLPPPVWSLGGPRSGAIAAELGTAFGYSLLYHSSVDDPAPLHRYRETFVPHTGGDTPATIVALCGFVTESEDAARELERSWTGQFFVPCISGTPRVVADRLAALRSRYGADEVMFCELAEAGDQRVRSLELLAEAAGTHPGLA